MVVFLRKDFKSLNRKPARAKTEKIEWINWKNEEALNAEIDSFPAHFLEDLYELYDSMTPEEKEKLKMPSRQQVMHFYNQIKKLCDVVGKTKAMNLLIQYSEKIAQLKDEFSKDVRRYAKVLHEFAIKYKKDVFDARLVELWLYDRSEFENFVSGSLNQIHLEYLFNQLGLGLN